MIELRTAYMNWDTNGVKNFDWPINRLDNKKLFEDLIFAYVTYAKGIKDPIMQTRLKILATEICILTHAVFISEKLTSYYKAKNTKINLPENYPLWNAAYNNDYSQLGHYSIFPLNRGFKKSPYWKQLLRPLRYLSKEGFKRGTLNKLNVSEDIICITHCPLTMKHQRQREQTVTILSYDEWFYPPEKVPAPIGSQDLIEHLINIATKNDIHPSEQAIEFLTKCVQQNLGWVDFYSQRLEKMKIPQELWLTSLGNSFGRILATKVLDNGGKVVVHDHAEGGSFSDDIRVPFNDLQLTSQFVTFTQYQAKHYKKLSKDVLIDNRPDITSISESEKVFQMPNVSISGKQKSLKDKPTILYPCPLIDRDVYSPAPLMSGIEMVDWQCRLFDQLNQAGFHINFKPHPLTKQPFPDYESKFNLKTIDEPFEDAMLKSEHILFDWTLTTTFGHALSYPVPITVIDFGIAHYNDETKKALQSRCQWVEGNTDKDNRSQVNWNKLITALKQPKEYVA